MLQAIIGFTVVCVEYIIRGKVKGKARPRTGHKGPEVE
jgi:hypothetical protein